MQEISKLVWLEIDTKIQGVINLLLGRAKSSEEFETPYIEDTVFSQGTNMELYLKTSTKKWMFEGDFGLVLHWGDSYDSSGGTFRKLTLYFLPKEDKAFEIASVCYLKRNSSQEVFRRLAWGRTVKDPRTLYPESAREFEKISMKAIRFANFVIGEIESVSQ